jgi:hypothetical protein
MIGRNLLLRNGVASVGHLNISIDGIASTCFGLLINKQG